jgi:hypothetical protein
VRADGDCYEAAGEYMVEHGLMRGESGLVLVHGEVTGQGPIEGVKYGHAWVEQGGMVIDQSMGRDIRMPRREYYTLGRIGKNLHRYTLEQMRRKVLETEHWGPWDLRTESGY